VSSYADGTFTTPYKAGPARTAFPFQSWDSLDGYAKVIMRDYIVRSDLYTPKLPLRNSGHNLLLSTEDLGNGTYWNIENGAVYANNYANPNTGLTTATNVHENNGTNLHGVSQNVAGLVAASYYYMSGFFRADARSNVGLMLQYTNSYFSSAIFDLSAGAVGTTVNTAGAGMVALDHSWFWCYMNVAAVDTSAACKLLTAINSAALFFTGTNATGAHMWGAQLHSVAYVGWPAPFVPTTTTQRFWSLAATPDGPYTDAMDNLTTANNDADPFAYLVDESPPVPINGRDYVRFTRTYARIPQSQTEWDSQLIVRPVMHDVSYTNNYGVSFDQGVSSHVFSARNNVESIGAITQESVSKNLTAEEISDFPSGPSFTMADTGGSSSTQTFTSTAATIKSGLTSALGAAVNIVVTKAPGRLTLQWETGVNYVTTTNAWITMEGDVGSGSVTFRMRQNAVTGSETELSYVPVRNINTASAHNGSVGEWLAAWSGGKLMGMVQAHAIPATNQITVPAGEYPWNIQNLNITHLAFAGQAANRYLAGPVSVSVRTTHNFYMPVVSPGINTAADIPLVSPELDPVGWLAAIRTGNTYAAVEGSQLERWNGWGIYRQSTVQAQMSDAIDVIAVNV